MPTRSTRSQPFCWQEKKILRLLKKQYQKSELVKFKCLYLVLTEIDSDFHGQPIKFYTKTIANYSGLSEKWIPQALQVLRELKIIYLIETRDDKKRVTGRDLIFTPEKMVEKPDSRKPNIRKPDSRRMLTLEDSSSLEDSIPLEDKTLQQPKNGCLKFDKSSLEMRMTNFAIKQIQKSHPGKQFTSKEKQKHCAVFDKLMRLDKKTKEQIQKTLKWLPDAPRNNGFCWADVILSPASLRNYKNGDDLTKFDKLYAAMMCSKKKEKKSKWTLGCK